MFRLVVGFLKPVPQEPSPLGTILNGNHYRWMGTSPKKQPFHFEPVSVRLTPTERQPFPMRSLSSRNFSLWKLFRNRHGFWWKHSDIGIFVNGEPWRIFLLESFSTGVSTTFTIHNHFPSNSSRQTHLLKKVPISIYFVRPIRKIDSLMHRTRAFSNRELTIPTDSLGNGKICLPGTAVFAVFSP